MNCDDLIIDITTVLTRSPDKSYDNLLRIYKSDPDEFIDNINEYITVFINRHLGEYIASLCELSKDYKFCISFTFEHIVQARMEGFDMIDLIYSNFKWDSKIYTECVDRAIAIRCPDVFNVVIDDIIHNFEDNTEFIYDYYLLRKLCTNFYSIHTHAEHIKNMLKMLNYVPVEIVYKISQSVDNYILSYMKHKLTDKQIFACLIHDNGNVNHRYMVFDMISNKCVITEDFYIKYINLLRVHLNTIFYIYLPPNLDLSFNNNQIMRELYELNDTEKKFEFVYEMLCNGYSPLKQPLNYPSSASNQQLETYLSCGANISRESIVSINQSDVRKVLQDKTDLILRCMESYITDSSCIKSYIYYNCSVI